MAAFPTVPPATRRRIFAFTAWILLAFVVFQVYHLSVSPSLRESLSPHLDSRPSFQKPDLDDGQFHWQNVQIHYPVTSPIPLPNGNARSVPRIQHAGITESTSAKAVRLERLAAVKEAFHHAWNGYKNNAWLADEVGPLSGGRNNFFGGWAASLVDALDTLWIMDMKEDFAEAVHAIDSIDFRTTDEAILNTFETTIRYMGGFLSAYDLSGSKYPSLLSKAMELGEMLLVAFDTPNRMPITRWNWKKAYDGEAQEADDNALAAEIGSLTLEFTRLSQLTGDGRFFDAVQRIMDQFERQQMSTKLPGMWPVIVDARNLQFDNHNEYTLGAMSDSLYEYLPKQHMLLGGRTEQYRNLYERAANAFSKHNFYRPMTEDNADILFSALVRANDEENGLELDNSMQHLVCFAGGMVAIAATIFDRPEDLDTAKKLVDGCIWAYRSMDHGMMAEVSHHVPCPDIDCQWNVTLWHNAIMDRESEADAESSVPYEDRLRAKIQNERLVPGYVSIDDRRYILRPEAIESIFIWYRISGDSSYQDKAWDMFEAIEKHTRTDIANAALDDVTTNPPTKSDRMESFWMAETLKYFYLTFADIDLISLDEYVLNTEAHPFLRPNR